MFKLLLNAMMLFAQPPPHCPDLSGRYLCQQSSEIKIIQENLSGQTIYTIIDEAGETHLPTDNVSYAHQGDNSRVQGTARHYCKNGTFNVQLKGQSKDQSNHIVDEWDITQVVKLDKNKNLVNQFIGYHTHAGHTNVINDTSHCRRF